MANCLLLVLGCVLAVSAISHAAHQVSFTGSKTLPQVSSELAEKSREISPQIRALHELMAELKRREVKRSGSNCDETCMEQRAENLLPTARRFLSSLSDDVARKFSKRKEKEDLVRAVRGITNALNVAHTKRNLVGSPMALAKRDGIIRGGIDEGARRSKFSEREVAFSTEKAAKTLKRAVEKRAIEKREQEEVQEVRAFIDDLEARSQRRSKEASRLGERAIEDLRGAMSLKKRAAEVRSFINEELQKRINGKLNVIKKRASAVQAKEKVKRGMKEIRAISEDLQKRELEKKEAKRSEVFDNLKTLAARVLKERDLENKVKREMKIAEAKRSADKYRTEKVRELAKSAIADNFAKVKRAFDKKRELDEQKAEKTRELAGMKIAEEMAKAKRAVAKRELEVRELAKKRFSEKFSSLKRAVEESKVKRALETMEKYRRGIEGGEESHLNAVRALEGLQAALQKRELDLKEKTGMKAARSIGKAAEKSKRSLETSKRDNALDELEALVAIKRAEAAEHNSAA